MCSFLFLLRKHPHLQKIMSETIKQRNVATDVLNEKEDAVTPALEEDIDDIKKVYMTRDER